jgi:hypothetical protein
VLAGSRQEVGSAVRVRFGGGQHKLAWVYGHKKDKPKKKDAEISSLGLRVSYGVVGGAGAERRHRHAHTHTHTLRRAYWIEARQGTKTRVGSLPCAKTRQILKKRR